MSWTVVCFKMQMTACRLCQNTPKKHLHFLVFFINFPLLSKKLNVAIHMFPHIHLIHCFTSHGLKKPVGHDYIPLILAISILKECLYDIGCCSDPVSNCDQYSLILFSCLSCSVLLMRGQVLTLVFGGSTASKPFRAQWIDSLLVCLTVS